MRTIVVPAWIESVSVNENVLFLGYDTYYYGEGPWRDIETEIVLCDKKEMQVQLLDTNRHPAHQLSTPKVFRQYILSHAEQIAGSE